MGDEIKKISPWPHGVPSRTVQTSTIISYSTSGRSTYCDIMCMKNTTVEQRVSEPSGKRLTALSASIPTMRSKAPTIGAPLPFEKTAYHKMKTIESRMRRNFEFHIERNEFMQRIILDRQNEKNAKEKAVVKIQSFYRGCTTRRHLRGGCFLKSTPSFSVAELRAELCHYAHSLSLKPIKGLSLENKSRNTKRLQKIEMAAAYRIQRFFSMIVARKKARRILEERVRSRKQQAGRKITGFFRFARTLVRFGTFSDKIKDNAATKIECHSRGFLAKQRVRRLRQQNKQNLIRQEAAIKIQRTLGRICREWEEQISCMMEALFGDVEECMLEIEIDFFLKEAQRQLAEEEAARVREVLRQQVEEAAMRLQEDEELKRAIEAERLRRQLEDLDLMSKEDAVCQTIEMLFRIEAKRAAEEILFSAEEVYERWRLAEILRLREVAQMEAAEAEAVLLRVIVREELREKLAEQARKEAELQREHFERQMMFSAEEDMRKFVSDEIAMREREERARLAAMESSERMDFSTEELPGAVLREVRGVLETAVDRLVKEEMRKWREVRARRFLELQRRKEEIRLERLREHEENDLMHCEEEDLRLVLRLQRDEERARQRRIEEEAYRAQAKLRWENEQKQLEAAVLEDAAKYSDLPPLTHEEVVTVIQEATGLFGRALEYNGLGISSARAEYLEQALKLLSPIVSRLELDRHLPVEIKRQTKILLSKMQIALGREKFKSAKYQDACDVFEAARCTRMRLFLGDGIEIAQALEGLARAECALTKYSEADGHYQLALTMIDEALKVGGLPESISDTDAHMQIITLSGAWSMRVDVLIGLGLLATERGKYHDASKNLKLALAAADVFEGATGAEGDNTANVPNFVISHPASPDRAMSMNSPSITKLFGESLALGFGESPEYRKRMSVVQVGTEYKISGARHAEVWVAKAAINKIRGKYEKAGTILTHVLDAQRIALGDEHPDIVVTLAALAEVQILRCKYDDAASFIETAMTMVLKFVSKDHPLAASVVFVKAKLANAMGYYKTAIDLMHISLERRRKVWLCPHPDIASSLFGLAEVLRLRGTPWEARSHYEGAWEMRKVLLDDGGKHAHAAVAEFIYGVALNFCEECRYSDAVPVFDMSIKMTEALVQSLGSSCMVDLEVRNTWMAYCLIQMGRYDEAKHLLLSAGKTLVQALGDSHVYVGDSLYVLGQLLYGKGRYGDAKMLFARCVDVFTACVGERHPFVARAALAAADNFRAVGYFEKAAEMLNLALGIYSSDHGSRDNVNLMKTIYLRAQIVRDNGDIDESEGLYKQVLGAVQEKLGDGNGLFAAVLGDMAENLRLQEKFTEAMEVNNRAQVLREKCFGAQHPLIIHTLITRALILLDLRQIQESIKILESKAIPMAMKLLGEAHALTAYAKGCLGVCLNELALASVPGEPTPKSKDNTSDESKSLASRRSQRGASKLRKQTSLRSFNSGASGGQRTPLSSRSRGGFSFTSQQRGDMLIEQAMVCFDDYPDMRFGDEHPWVLELGGWTGDSATSQSNRSVQEFPSVNEIAEDDHQKGELAPLATLEMEQGDLMGSSISSLEGGSTEIFTDEILARQQSSPGSSVGKGSSHQIDSHLSEARITDLMNALAVEQPTTSNSTPML